MVFLPGLLEWFIKKSLLSEPQTVVFFSFFFLITAFLRFTFLIVYSSKMHI